MALPTIPTSFVPHSSTQSPDRRTGIFPNIFGFFSYAVFGIALLLALGIFFYGRILVTQEVSKESVLATAEAAIDPATVEGFVRLRNRLNAGAALLDKHISLSGFFTLLNGVLPSGIQFTALHISADSSGVVSVDGNGVAKNFNVLAAASVAFSGTGKIKDVIFSNMSVNRDTSVNFDLSAELDQKVTTFSP